MTTHGLQWDCIQQGFLVTISAEETSQEPEIRSLFFSSCCFIFSSPGGRKKGKETALWFLIQHVSNMRLSWCLLLPTASRQGQRGLHSLDCRFSSLLHEKPSQSSFGGFPPILIHLFSQTSDISWSQTADQFLWQQVKYFLTGNLFFQAQKNLPGYSPHPAMWDEMSLSKAIRREAVPSPFSPAMEPGPDSAQPVGTCSVPATVRGEHVLVLPWKPMRFKRMHTRPVGSISTSQLFLLSARGEEHYTDQGRPIILPCKQCLLGSASCVIYVPRTANSTGGDLSGLKMAVPGHHKN